MAIDLQAMVRKDTTSLKEIISQIDSNQEIISTEAMLGTTPMKEETAIINKLRSN